MADPTVQRAFSLAVQHHNRGEFAEAERLYRQIISLDPDHADALHMLGIIVRKTGDAAAAIELIRRAIAINPACANASFNLGNALRDDGQRDAAMSAYRAAISLGQNLPQSFHNLGCLLADEGRLREAAAAFAQAGDLNSAARRGAAADAGRAARLALAWYNLGNSMREKRQFADAIGAYERAVLIEPKFAEAYCNLGNALVEEHQLDAAVGAYQQAIGLNPDLPQAHFNLGKAMYDKGELDEAIAANRRAIELRSDYAGPRRNLGNCLVESRLLDEAIATYREALCGDVETNSRTEGNLIYALHFHPAWHGREIAAEARRWNLKYAEPLAQFIKPHGNDRAPERRLRVGYVSPDFRNHVVGGNLVPLFLHHNHQQFEIICYNGVSRGDSMTHWFKQHADGWRDTFGKSDEELAGQIREDGIDILVDLALHTADSRLLTFARKPAPVQVTFAGYPGSTGLTAIDYRISDPYLDPPESDESLCSEKTIRLPHSFWCYDPGDCGDIPVSPLPAVSSGIVTFGCLNNFCKITDPMLDLWAKVMQQVEGSRLLLLAKQGRHRRQIMSEFADRGIEPHRIEIISYGPRRGYLEQYHRIDIGLDTFPYNGHTTSLDSLWMGVPVVTLVGDIPVARAGWCQLSNLGLTEFAASSPGQFLKIAVDLAHDVPRLERLRSDLRGCMEKSPLMDAAGFASGIEGAYRRMWRHWCGVRAI